MRLLHPSQVTPEPWANGGGQTRTLLSWSDPRHWSVRIRGNGDSPHFVEMGTVPISHWGVRISVADVERAGPFSVFPGVERWFAVLDGDGVRLTTAGRAPVDVRPTDEAMHAFPGDDTTDCGLLGRPTRDLNVMARRGEVRVTIRPLRSATVVRSIADLLGCFVCEDAELATGKGAPIALPRHTLAWLENHSRETLDWQVATPAPRGWWIEANRTP